MNKNEMRDCDETMQMIDNDLALSGLIKRLINESALDFSNIAYKMSVEEALMAFSCALLDELRVNKKIKFIK